MKFSELTSFMEYPPVRSSITAGTTILDDASGQIESAGGQPDGAFDFTFDFNFQFPVSFPQSGTGSVSVRLSGLKTKHFNFTSLGISSVPGCETKLCRMREAVNSA